MQFSLSTFPPRRLRVLVLAVLSAALLVAPVTGRALAQVVTLVHELGHAAVGLLVGGRVRRVSIALDASGETLTLIGGRHPRTRLSAFTLAGYPAPPLIGLAAAASVASVAAPASAASPRTMLPQCDICCLL